MYSKEERIELYKDAVKQWGEVPQLLMCCEEMAELTEELLHMIRGRKDLNVYEEIADVELCMEQLHHMLNNDAEIDRWRIIKLDRLKERLNASREARKNGCL